MVVGPDGPCERFSVAVRGQFSMFRVMRSRAPHPCGDASIGWSIMGSIRWAFWPKVLRPQVFELASCRGNFLKFLPPEQLPRLNLVEKERFIEENFSIRCINISHLYITPEKYYLYL